MTSFSFSHFCKDPASEHSHTLRSWGLGLRHSRLWVDMIQLTTSLILFFVPQSPLGDSFHRPDWVGLPLPFWPRNRSQALSSEASVDEGGVFESLKAEAASPPALFSGLSGLPAGSLPAAPFPSSLVLGSSASGGDVFIQMPASREEGGGRGEGGTYHHRPPPHHFHHGGHRGSSLLQHVGGDHRGHSDEGGDEQPGTPAPALSELKAVVCWLQKGLPFILILLAKLCFQHKLGESQGRGDFGCRGGGSPSQTREGPQRPSPCRALKSMGF